MSDSQRIEQLAAALGEEVYLDVAKWHLFLADAKLHLPLAEKLLPMVDEGRIDEDAVVEVLKGVPVQLGGGRTQLSLFDLLPMQGIMTAIDLLEKFADR
ncbi:DUF3181 family protein [Synechococcus sp. PCC 7336]|uniref:DUF3181 family protein n=1 Tax=Synechococcus sp. PCC 7336 TaxID=195250 RepID=UPI000347FF94|nr:DUF3181 family protein [Synechococcus sp. PCC 7336]